jgi:hypothetical protein
MAENYREEIYDEMKHALKAQFAQLPDWVAQQYLTQFDDQVFR